jgi:ubiquinone/menaquinone biosynthesis C-methylase UbiE
MQIADLNAGAGFFTRALARVVGPEGVVWALDCNRELLPRVKALAAGEGLHNVEVVHGTLERLHGSHLPEDRFDAAVAANLFFTLDDKAMAVREMYRIVRPGGKAAVIDWKDSFGGLGPHPSHIVSADEAKRIFESVGFVSAGELPAGEYHWGLLFRKKT